jgi:hypothetical protein
VHTFKVDTVKLTQKFNSEYKEQIRKVINYNGQFATHLNTSYIFGHKFKRFWEMFFSTGTLNLKHEYIQIQVEQKPF